MKTEYMKNMLIDRLIGLDYIYPSDFITKMKNYISDEEDIEKLKDLDGFVTDRVYLDYFKRNIQEKLAEQSMSIFEVKNMIKNSSGVGIGEKESVYSGRDLSYRGGFNSGVVEKDIVKVKVADNYKNADRCAEDEEDEIDIDLNDEDSVDSDSLYDNKEDDSDEDDIDIDLEEDLEEEDLEEEDETDIDLGDDEDEIDIDLEEDDSEEDNLEEDDLLEEDDFEEDDEIDINLEEDEDDMDFDYEDNDFSGDDSDEDGIDINLEEDEDDSDEIDIDLEEDEDDIGIDLGEDDIDIDLGEDEDDSDSIDIDLEDDEDIDVDLEDEEEYITDTTHSNTPKPKENKQQHENRVKEKVFNNNFSNNTWDILNGAVDGVSNFFKRK